jgi:hypothetical protein
MNIYFEYIYYIFENKLMHIYEHNILLYSGFEFKC